MVFLAATGCETIPPGQMEKFTIEINSGMDALANAVSESGFVKDEEMDRLIADMAVVKTSTIAGAKKLDEQIDGDKLEAWIEAAMIANKESAPINPYYGMIGGVLGIALAVKKTLDAGKSNTAVREIVAGVEEFKKRPSSMSETLNNLKMNLSTSTSPTTKNIVSVIRNSG